MIQARKHARRRGPAIVRSQDSFIFRQAFAPPVSTRLRDYLIYSSYSPVGFPVYSGIVRALYFRAGFLVSAGCGAGRGRRCFPANNYFPAIATARAGVWGRASALARAGVHRRITRSRAGFRVRLAIADFGPANAFRLPGLFGLLFRFAIILLFAAWIRYYFPLHSSQRFPLSTGLDRQFAPFFQFRV